MNLNFILSYDNAQVNHEDRMEDLKRKQLFTLEPNVAERETNIAEQNAKIEEAKDEVSQIEIIARKSKLALQI